MPTSALTKRVSAVADELSRTRRLLASPTLPNRSRAWLACLAATRWASPSSSWNFRIAGMAVWISRGHWRFDVMTLERIFVRGQYHTDYREAAVIDIGAHKGYFGAYALAGGASAVISYEPDTENYLLLTRSAAANSKPGRRWDAVNAAVGDGGGTAVLYLTEQSRSHSMIRRSSREIRGTAVVSMVSLEEAVRRAAPLGRRLVVKINAEGAECGIVLGSSDHTWEAVDEVFLATHSFAPCTEAALFTRMRNAGFVSMRKIAQRLYHFHRVSLS